MGGKIDNKPYVIDIMERIADERKRLEKNIASPEYESNPQWSWMEEWLKKTDEEHYKDMKQSYDNVHCNVCGRKTRFFIAVDFSFCNEYDCGIQICSKCVKKLSKIFSDGVKEKVGGGQAE